MRRLTLAFPLIALLLAAPAPAGEPAPRIHLTREDRLRPLPAPYDAKADAKADVAAAIERAKISGKPVVIDFGANWCPDCRVLAGAIELPDLRSYIDRNFELVQVDVGKFDRNLDIPTSFGAKRLTAIPAVFIVDAKTRQLRNPDKIMALGDATAMGPQSIANWLAKWAP